MELFSEIYGAYFRTAERILSKGRLTPKEVQQLIQEEAFRDSMLFLPQKLMPESGESWELLRKTEDGMLERVTKHAPPAFLTLLQKRWLRSKLDDPKMRLFLTDAEFQSLSERLQDVQPLYPAGVFRYFDKFTDGDPYESPQYGAVFRTVLRAIGRHEVLAVDYMTGKGKSLRGHFLPLKLEYSQKNDKFRLYCIRMGKRGAGGSGMLNLGRIAAANPTGKRYMEDGLLEGVLERRRCSEPVQVLVSGERNGIERFLMECASFEKRTEMDEESRRCTVWLWYDQQDETELLIRLLGFGPVVEILGPPAFRAQAAERVERQYALLQ